MHVVSFFFALVGAASVHTLAENVTCQNPVVRQEWRQLSEATRQNYLDAVKCLKSKPSRLGLKTPLYDDFPYVHARLDNEIHFVASFLPWHRYFVHVYEKAIQECGYEGAATYWDWSLDTSDVPGSSIWDARSGFGGNGVRPGPNGTNTPKCIQDGPFKDLRVHYSQLETKEHCLEREWNDGTEEAGDMLAQFYTPEVVNKAQQITNYNDYRIELEGGPHGALHSAIGGDMTPSTSPNDPIFFLHHGQIDRLWTLWQAKDQENRALDYSGIKTQDQFDGVTPPPASLRDIMPMLGLAADVPVEEYMSTLGGPLCYRY
ncbi:hypothetical protein LCI18_003428 [Fusarium solani-melongenae]|uniref:Uncharacterized protein n=1 Tax=Fusarium solani subsp. cucurbitae TaxID=2747967 RepID=A0ACD3YXB4_FUSSC|nr:hypothetical protein LCI18_003428 [Fusarium solani-melongenae]